MHRAERATPTTRSWIPPRTFFTQVRFSRSGNFSPRQGPPATPSGPENAGQKGQKSSPPGPAFRAGPEGDPRPRGNTSGSAPAAEQTGPARRTGKQARRPSETHGNRPWLSLFSTPTPTLARAGDGDHNPGCRPHGRMGINERATNTKQRPPGNTAGGGKPIIRQM